MNPLGNTNLGNVGNRSHKESAPYPRRSEPSASTFSEIRISSTASCLQPTETFFRFYTQTNVKNFLTCIFSCLNFTQRATNRISSPVPTFRERLNVGSYVYWTVHQLDSWIKIDQLDVICFIISLFTAQHVSNVSTSIFRSLRLIVDLFHVLYCSGSMCVGVDGVVRLGWCGILMQAEALLQPPGKIPCLNVESFLAYQL